MEVWKDISGYEGYYQVSDLGRVKSLSRKNSKTERILKAYTTSKGYLRLNFNKDGKSFKPLVHRLVAEAFIPNPENKQQVNHINEVKTDNYIENLEWSTNIENKNHGNGIERQRIKMINGKLSISVSQFDKGGNHIKDWISISEAKRNGFSETCISSCINGKQKTHKGFVWIKLKSE